MANISQYVAQGAVALTKLPVPVIVAIMTVPIGFVGWLLQQFAQRRASRRSTMGRLKANLAYLHVALVRATKSANLDNVGILPTGRLQETIDDDIALHTVLARRELDLLRECIIEIEARLMRHACRPSHKPRRFHEISTSCQGCSSSNSATHHSR